MRSVALFSLIAVCAILLPAQRRDIALSVTDSVSIDRVSVGADYAGREALCDQLRRMSTRRENVPIVPENAELLCEGNGKTIFALRLKTTPTSAEKTICDLAAMPSGIVFYQLRPIALRSGSTVTMPQDLSEKLQPLGITTVGRLLSSFGFSNLQLRVGDAHRPLQEIGVHELDRLCKG